VEVSYAGKFSIAGGVILILAVGWIAYPRALYKKIDQPIQFSHKIHTGEKAGLTCDACHSLRPDGSFAGIPTIENCAQCHSEVQGKSPDEKVLVENYVVPKREVPWLVYARQPENAHFPHAPHLTAAKIACDRCHGPHGSTDRLRPFEVNRISGYSRDIWGRRISGIRTSESDGMKMSDCCRCHAQRGVTDSCLMCHK
jgi:menaquinone reductase, multiheme cytochrome c subunit